MKLRKHALCIVSLIVLLGASTAFGQVSFRDVVAFGDSLTDNDLLGLYYGNPPAMYGRDPIHAVFHKGAASDDDLQKYAVATSESDDLETQIDVYEGLLLADLVDKATLISIEIGGNDVKNNVDLLAGAPPGRDASADEVVNNIIHNIKEAWLRLRSSHPSARFVIWTIGDVTRTPDLWNDLTRGEASNVRAHIQRVNRYIRTLSNNASVIVLDLYVEVRRWVAAPPVIFGHSLVPPPDYGEYDHIFADRIHPTAVTNAILANLIIDKMNSKWNDRIPRYTNAQLAGFAHISR